MSRKCHLHQLQDTPNRCVLSLFLNNSTVLLPLLCPVGYSTDSGHRQRKIARQAWPSWRVMQREVAAPKMSVDAYLMKQRCSTRWCIQEQICGVPCTRAGTFWIGSSQGHGASAVDLWALVLHGRNGSDHKWLKLIWYFLYSHEDAITVVDPVDDELIDKHLCHHCHQRVPD